MKKPFALQLLQDNAGCSRSARGDSGGWYKVHAVRWKKLENKDHDVMCLVERQHLWGDFRLKWMRCDYSNGSQVQLAKEFFQTVLVDGLDDLFSKGRCHKNQLQWGCVMSAMQRLLSPQNGDAEDKFSMEHIAQAQLSMEKARLIGSTIWPHEYVWRVKEIQDSFQKGFLKLDAMKKLLNMNSHLNLVKATGGRKLLRMSQPRECRRLLVVGIARSPGEKQLR